jgi:hypothetical protein
MPGRPISTSELQLASTCRFAADETLLTEAASQTPRSPGYMKVVNAAFDARMRLLGKAPHSVYCRARNWVLEASPLSNHGNELGNRSKPHGQRRWRKLPPLH